MNKAYKLGKKAVKLDKRTLKLEKYLSKALVPPHNLNWGKPIQQWQMMKNDEIGDCTCAGAGHLIMTWTANAGVLYTPPDNEILKAYEATGGYIPGDPSTDNGATELDVLNYWRRNGIAGHKIGAFVSINPRNIQHLKIAAWLFGGIYTGVMLTQSDMDAIQSGENTWRYNKSPFIGGHAVPAIGYNNKGFQFITWGMVQTATYEWVYNRVEEAYAIISHDWIKNTGKAPSGFDINQLSNDLNLVKN